MELRRPRPPESNTETAANQQSEALQSRPVGVSSLNALFSALLLLAVAGGGYWGWKSGFLEACIGAVSEAEQMDDVQREMARIDENMATCRALEANFEGASVDLWENAVPEDRAVKGQSAVMFTGLIPDGEEGHVLLQVTIESGQPLQVKKFSPACGMVEISETEFNELIALTPYLVVREHRAYLSTSGKKARDMEFPVPGKDGVLNPACEIFGSILTKIDLLKMKRPTHRYEVSLELKGLKKSIPVAVVRFGETVSRNDFLVAIQKELTDRESCEMLLSAGTAKVEIAK